MNIIKMGDVREINGYWFECESCGCQWVAERREVTFTPPCLPFDVYMKCPTCKKTVYYKKEV